MADPYDLERFVQAQAPVWEAVRSELAAGSKRSHWMWFVFPQLKGLGRSATALHYGLASLAEAHAYAAHPVLGPRLLEATRLMLAIADRSALQVLGSPDDLKFRSCMTLFGRAVPQHAEFRHALDRYFGGAEDERTLALLA